MTVRIVTATQAEGKEWATALLAAAGPARKMEVVTEHERGAFIAFVVPEDVYEAAVEAGMDDVLAEAAKAETNATAAAKKAAKAVKAAVAKKDDAEVPPPPPVVPPAGDAAGSGEGSEGANPAGA